MPAAKFHYIITIISLILIWYGCSTHNTLVKKKQNNTSTVTRFKQVDMGKICYINMRFYDFRHQPIPAFVSINGVNYSEICDEKPTTKNYIIPVGPGEYKIEADFIGKKKKVLNITIGKQDSVVAKIYMEDKTITTYD